MFLRTASDPISPFSDESASARQVAVDGWRLVVDGSDTAIPDAIADELPELLRLFQMGVVLFWVHEGTKARRTWLRPGCSSTGRARS